MQDIKRCELRERRSNKKTRICFEVRATALHRAFTQKDFHYVHTRTFTKEPPTRNYKYNPRVHKSTLSNTITST